MIILVTLLMFIEFAKAVSKITFQKGSSNSFYFNGNNFDFQVPEGQEKILSVEYFFPKTFERVPQVYLVLTQIEQKNENPFGYNLEINTITTSGFVVTVTFPYPSKYYGIIFNWYAFDDQRRAVLSAFNYKNPESQYTFSHSNINFDRAVVSLLSFQAEAFVETNIQIDSITSNSITVNFIIPNFTKGLSYVSFQILIGTQESMYIGPGIQYPSTSQYLLIETTTIDYPTEWLEVEAILPLGGIVWGWYEEFINIKISQQSSNSEITFQTETWGSWLVQQFQMNLNYCVFLGQLDPGTTKPMLYQQFSQYRIFDEENSIDSKLIISSLAVTLESTQSQTYILDKQSNVLAVEIYVKCIGTEKWQMKILKCLNQYNTYYTQCSSDKQLSKLKYNIQFLQSDKINQIITATISGNYIQIIQNLLDQEEENHVILDLRY